VKESRSIVQPKMKNNRKIP